MPGELSSFFRVNSKCTADHAFFSKIIIINNIISKEKLKNKLILIANITIHKIQCQKDKQCEQIMKLHNEFLSQYMESTATFRRKGKRKEKTENDLQGMHSSQLLAPPPEEELTEHSLKDLANVGLE